MHGRRLLVAEDDKVVCYSLRVLLESAGYEVDLASNGIDAWNLIKRHKYPLVLSDINLAGVDGREILDRTKRYDLDCDLILFTGYGSVADAVECIKKGAHDYFTKPIDNDKLLAAIQRVLERKALKAEALGLKRQFGKKGYPDLVYRSRTMEELLRKARIVAKTDATILITGQSGTGKTRLAKYIHSNSKKKEHPFVEVSCGALTESLLESELFGHKRGAFTGADKDKIGKFESAAHGTIFLDDINSASLGLQIKLLRVIEEKVFERVGDTKTIRAHARIVAATNKDLRELSKQDKFREDLFHRLNVVSLRIPNLQERKEDIPVLIEYFLHSSSNKYQKPIVSTAQDVREALCDYHWPGNVRELENVIERAVIFSQNGTLKISDIPGYITNDRGLSTLSEGNLNLSFVLEKYEKIHIARTLELNHGNRNRTAKQLSISRATLFNKMKKYGFL